MFAQGNSTKYLSGHASLPTLRPLNCLLIAFYEPLPLPQPPALPLLPPPRLLRHFTVEENLNCIEGRAEMSSCSSYFPLLLLLPLLLELLWSHPVQTPCQLCLQLGFATDLIRWKFHKIVEISATFTNCSTCIFWVIARGGGEGKERGSCRRRSS